MRMIKNRQHLFEAWNKESDRFCSLFGGLSQKQLSQEAITSGCGHSLGDHILCIYAWMEEGRRVLINYLEFNIPLPQTGDVLEYTNALLAPFRGESYDEIFVLIKRCELGYQYFLEKWGEKKVFGNKAIWDWLIWTSVGHYDEHSTELEWQLGGRTDIPPDEVWSNPYLESR